MSHRVQGYIRGEWDGICVTEDLSSVELGHNPISGPVTNLASRARLALHGEEEGAAQTSSESEDLKAIDSRSS
jgi:hypothetical protein